MLIRVMVTDRQTLRYRQYTSLSFAGEQCIERTRHEHCSSFVEEQNFKDV